jgi:cell wall-associated NlpC family hydrolase
MTLDKRLNACRDDLAAESLRGRVEAKAFTPGTQKQVAIGVAPLKEAPDWEARLASEMLFGEPVTVYDERDGWAWVQAASDAYVGYTPSDGLEAPGPAATHRVSALHTILYPEPDLKSAPLDMLPLSADLALSGAARGDFAEMAGGGWVFRGHVAQATMPRPDFVAIAERFLWTPYLWGGKSSRGIDCSGLVQVALRAAGHQAMRDTDMQAGSLGREVDRAAPRARGDIVYFPGHVGIMLDGERLLHANAWSMTVAIHPLAEVVARLAATHAEPITCVRRL